MSDKKNLLHCPFCGNLIKGSIEDIKPNKYGREGQNYKVKCPNCGVDILCGREDFNGKNTE